MEREEIKKNLDKIEEMNKKLKELYIREDRRFPVKKKSTDTSNLIIREGAIIESKDFKTIRNEKTLICSTINYE